MQEKKTPSVKQMSEYREWCRTANTNEMLARIDEFENEYNVFTQAYQENGCYGVKDACGEVLIPARFDEIAYTFNDRFRKWAVPAIKDSKMAFAAPNGKGTLLTPFEYDAINFRLGYYFLLKEGKMGLADILGNIIIPAEMEIVYEPCNDLVVFAKDGKYGFAIIGTDLRTEAIYDNYELDDSTSEYLVAEKDGVKGYIDKNGNFTTDDDERFFCAGWS